MSKGGTIYAIGMEGTSLIKIGSTSNSIESRLRTMQTGQPFPLHVIAHIPVETDVQKIERHVHAFLAAERRRGEWFDIEIDSESLAALVVRAVQFIQDEETQHSSIRRQDKVRQLIAERLRELHLRQKALVPVLEISASAITRKMRGQTPFTDEDVKRISIFLRMPDSFAYPTLYTDTAPFYENYDPGLQVLNDAMIQLPLRDKSEMYFIMAVFLEGKLPRTNFGTILRELATQP